MRVTKMSRRIAAIGLCICLVLSVGGCSKNGDGADSPADNTEVKTEQRTEGVTTSFLEDTVFTVADKRVSMTEWYLYALSSAARIESMYGKSIWDYAVDSDGTTMSNMIKDDIRDRIVYVKTVSGRAESMGISINEDDQIDINLQTEDFLSKLTDSRKDQYGINADVVKSVLSENLLAMKVYENLTLNIDTYIPDDEVRHMVLEYIMIPKTYEDEMSGAITEYSETEMAAMVSKGRAYLDSILSEGRITALDELDDGEYTVVTLIADYKELKEKFPEDLAGIAFSLRQNEISGLYETDAGYFILDCVNRTDEKTTNSARVEIIEERQKTLFENEYLSWEKDIVVKYNYKLWDDITLHP